MKIVTFVESERFGTYKIGTNQGKYYLYNSLEYSECSREIEKVAYQLQDVTHILRMEQRPFLQHQCFEQEVKEHN